MVKANSSSPLYPPRGRFGLLRRAPSLEEQQFCAEELRAFLVKFAASRSSSSMLERNRPSLLKASSILLQADAVVDEEVPPMTAPDVAKSCWPCRESEMAQWLCDELPPGAMDIEEVPGHIFRGMSISRVLRAGPALMNNTAEAQNCYELSQQIDSKDLDTFLSHTWTSNNYLKYLALLYHFNGRFSFVMAHAAALLTFLCLVAIKYAGYSDCLPRFYMPIPGNPDYPRGLPVCGPCFFVGCAVQIFSYIFGHLFDCRAVPRQTLFLDKCCIHQTDPELKREGIYNVGGFVAQSRSMFVPWDDNYFERLWCTYEVAAFVRSAASKGKDVLKSLKFMPIQVAVFVFATMVAGFVGTTGFMFMIVINDQLWQFWLPQNWLEYFAIWGTGGTLVFGVPKFVFCHLSVQSRRALADKLKNFSVQDAKVAVEEDRAVIENYICGWFGQLEVFNEVVQKIFPEIVYRSLGTEEQVVRFWDCLQENAGVLFLFIYDAAVLAMPKEGLEGDWRPTLLCLLLGLSAHLVIDPLFLYLLNLLARLVLGMEGATEGTKSVLRAFGVFFLGLVYPIWFAFCLNSPLAVVALTSACLGTLVPCIFKR
jgi:hypothetical protein